MPAIDLEFDPRHKSALSIRSVLVEHLTMICVAALALIEISTLRIARGMVLAFLMIQFEVNYESGSNGPL